MPTKIARNITTVSAIPGRVRLQTAGEFRNQKCLKEVADYAAALPGVANAEIVPGAFSIIVRYSASALPLKEMKSLLEAAPMTRPVAQTSVRNGATPSTPEFAVVRQASDAPVVAEVRRPKPKSVDPSKHHIRVKHFFPGRLRLHVPHLTGRKHLATEFQQRVSKEPGVTRVETNIDGGHVIVHYDSRIHKSTGLIGHVRSALYQSLHAISHPTADNPRVVEPPQEVKAAQLTKEERPALNPLIFPSIAVAISVAGAGLPIAVLGTALAVASIPTAAGALDGMRQKRFNVAQLDFAALVALGALGEFMTGGIMTWLIGLGELIRTKTMRRSRKAIGELMSPEGQSAWIEVDGQVVSLPVSRLNMGDIVCVYPGDHVPVDGVVIEGRGLIDQKMLTGESVPVPKEVGDAVFALTIVSDGQMRVRVEHIGATTRAGRLVEMIENAPLSDTRVSNYAAKVGDRLVPGIFALAGVVFFATADLARTASILILDFVTGIRVSAPTTILSAMTGAAKQSIFIKGGKAMETLAEVNAIVFDKTGTLTYGEPFVTEIVPTDTAYTSDEVLRLAASAEANLKHPAAKAIVDAAIARGLEVVPPVEMEYLMGQGVSAVVNGKPLQVGSRRYMNTLGVDITRVTTLIERSAAAANSLVFCAVNNRLIGLISYSDTPREECEMVIRALRERGVQRIVMLTGDNRRAAEAVAGRLGITDIIAEAFPEQKADVVGSLRDEGYIVAVIGDGINDSPAFTRANVGISMQHGADVAKETADVILLDGDLRGLPRAIDLSREAIGILKQNVNVIIAPTAIGMAAAAVGLSNPLISTFINNGTTVVTALNALRPMFPKPHVNEKLPAIAGPMPMADAQREQEPA